MLLAACNSDVPVSAPAVIDPPGWRVTVTRVATHPFLARYNLSLSVAAPGGCSAVSELFPDTGGVSRRNVYVAASGELFVIGQFDARRFDEPRCRVELIEFRSVGTQMTFVGAFDVDDTGRWAFLPAGARAERPFEKL